MGRGQGPHLHKQDFGRAIRDTGDGSGERIATRRRGAGQGSPTRQGPRDSPLVQDKVAPGGTGAGCTSLLCEGRRAARGLGGRAGAPGAVQDARHARRDGRQGGGGRPIVIGCTCPMDGLPCHRDIIRRAVVRRAATMQKADEEKRARRWRSFDRGQSRDRDRSRSRPRRSRASATAPTLETRRAYMAPRGRPAPPGSPPEPLGPRFSNSPPPKTLTPDPRRSHFLFNTVRPRPVECNRCEPVAVARWPRRPVCFAPLRPPEPARAPRPRGQRPRRRRLPASGCEGRFGQTCSATYKSLVGLHSWPRQLSQHLEPCTAPHSTARPGPTR